MANPENIIGMGMIGGVYGAGSLMFRSYREGRGIPPLAILGREALSEATEWAGAMFMTELFFSDQFPQEVRGVGQFLTVALWLEAIFPRVIGER